MTSSADAVFCSGIAFTVGSMHHKVIHLLLKREEYGKGTGLSTCDQQQNENMQDPFGRVHGPIMAL